MEQQQPICSKCYKPLFRWHGVTMPCECEERPLDPLLVAAWRLVQSEAALRTAQQHLKDAVERKRHYADEVERLIQEYKAARMAFQSLKDILL